MRKKNPVGFTVLSSKLDVVRRIATELGFKYTEEAAPDCGDSVHFSFEKLSDEQTMKLINAVPRDAYYFHAVILKS